MDANGPTVGDADVGVKEGDAVGCPKVGLNVGASVG